MRSSKEKHNPSDWERLYEKMTVLRMAMGKEEEFERQRWRQGRYSKHRGNMSRVHTGKQEECLGNKEDSMWLKCRILQVEK